MEIANYKRTVREEVQADVLRMYQDGKSIDDIAGAVGRCYTTVRDMLFRAGVFVPKYRVDGMAGTIGGISPVELQRIIRETRIRQAVEVKTPSGEIVKGRIEEKYPHFARVAYYIRGNRFTEDIRYLDLHKKAKAR